MKADIKSWFMFPQGAMLLYMPVLLAIGIGGYFSLTFEPELSQVLAGFCLLSAVFLGVQGESFEEPRFKWIKAFAFIFLVIAGGFTAAKIRTDLVAAPVLAGEMNAVDVKGRITAIDLLPEDDGGRIILDRLQIEGINGSDTPHSVRIKVRDVSGLRPGQRVSALAGLNPPSPPIAPGAFDFQRYSFFRQLGAVGFAYYKPEILEQAPRHGWALWWEELRLTISHKVEQAIQGPRAGIISTFMTGEKTAIAENDLEAMRGAGLAHLLAISGLHVGLVAGVIFFFLRTGMACILALALQYPIKKYAAFAALIGALFYTFLVGATVPTQRAMMMTGVALFAVMIDRSPFSLRLVALAAIIILLVFPESLVSASFQMSFSAVTMLIWFYDRFRPHIQALYKEAGMIRRLLLYLLGVAMTTIIASAATAPFALYHFQDWSLYGPLANVIAMPVMVFWVMPLAVFSYVLMPFDLAAWMLFPMSYGVGWIVDAAHWVSGMEGSQLVIAAFPQSVIICLTLAVLLFILGPAIMRLIAPVLIIVAGMSFFFAQPADIYISSQGNLTGLNMPGLGLAVSDKRTDRYTRENWEQLLGFQDSQSWPEEGRMKNLRCDGQGCRHTWKNINIAFPHQVYAQAQACGWADLIIVREPPSLNCPSAQTLGYYHALQNGASAIYFNDNGTYRIQTDRDVRGQRPWVKYQ